jgi:hypothetical protein
MKKTLEFIKDNKTTSLVLLLFSTLLTYQLFRNLDTDILWHLKIGEEIVKTKSVSTVDTFSWQEGLQWINYEWIYDIIIYIIVKLFDIKGFGILFIINSTLLYLYAASENKCYNKALYVITVVATTLAFPRNYGNRPSEFSIWIAILVIAVHKKISIEDKKSEFKKDLLIAMISLFTANFHGGMIATILIMLIVVILAEQLVDVYNKEFKLENLLNGLEELIVYIAAALINPAGIKMITNSFRLASVNSTKYIEEWTSADNNYKLTFIVLLTAISFGYKLIKSKYNKEVVVNIALMCALLMAGLRMQKAFLVYEYIWLIYGYTYLEDMIYEILRITKKKSIDNRDYKRWRVYKPALVAILVTCTIICYDEPESFEQYVNNTTSMEIIDKLKELPEGTRILSGYTEGNYLIYNDIKCFIDSRQQPYIKEFGKNSSLDDTIEARVSFSRETVKGFIDKYSFDYIWTSEGLNLDWYLETDERFEKIITDEDNQASLWKRI